jgi:hypothetical protein
MATRRQQKGGRQQHYSTKNLDDILHDISSNLLAKLQKNNRSHRMKCGFLLKNLSFFSLFNDLRNPTTTFLLTFATRI